jgi:DNA-binding response OmpR family regulator
MPAAMSKILIIEDESDLARGLKDNCEFDGYHVDVCKDGESGIAQALRGSPDLILLDLMLPKISGIDVCRNLRAKSISAPIIMLTARGADADKLLGFEVGADDYVTKPFNISELMARIRVHLRRYNSPILAPERYEFADVKIDFRRHLATKGDVTLDLTPREFDLLKYFVQHRGACVSRDELLDHVWGVNNYPLTRTVDIHIARLRQKIERFADKPEFIVTIHKKGYKFLG